MLSPGSAIASGRRLGSATHMPIGSNRCASSSGSISRASAVMATATVATDGSVGTRHCTMLVGHCTGNKRTPRHSYCHHRGLQAALPSCPRHSGRYGAASCPSPAWLLRSMQAMSALRTRDPTAWSAPCGVQLCIRQQRVFFPMIGAMGIAAASLLQPAAERACTIPD